MFYKCLTISFCQVLLSIKISSNDLFCFLFQHFDGIQCVFCDGMLGLVFSYSSSVNTARCHNTCVYISTVATVSASFGQYTALDHFGLSVFNPIDGFLWAIQVGREGGRTLICPLSCKSKSPCLQSIYCFCWIKRNICNTKLF